MDSRRPENEEFADEGSSAGESSGSEGEDSRTRSRSYSGSSSDSGSGSGSGSGTRSYSGSGSYSDDVRDSGDENEDDDDESSEIAEPWLKYHRLSAHATKLLTQFAASCVSIHEHFMVLGTHQGVVFCLDLIGGELLRYNAHTMKVNAVSVDQAGRNIGSCSEDGTVVIQSVTWRPDANGHAAAMTAGDRSNYNYYRNVAAVQIDPHFSSTSTFYSGGIAGKCVRNSKAWLRFSNQDFTIHDGEGPITTMKWGGAMLAWANNQGVKIYDTSKNMRISYVQRPAKMAAVCRCHLMWESVDSLLIGWADSIKIVALKPRMNPSTKKMQVVAEITSVIETPFIICGICPFGPHNLAVLAYVTEDADDNDDSDGGGGGAAAAGPRSPVELRILNRRNGEPLSEDELPLKDFSAFGPTDFSLEALDRSQKPGQALAGGGPNSYPTMYVVSPRDIVVAQPRDAKDKIMWAKNAGHYSLALRLCKEYPSALSADAVAAIGERYLVELTSDQLPAEQRNFPLAAKLCPELLGDDVDRWEQWVTLFFAMGQLTAIEPYLPTENPRLNKGTYEMVLNHFLTNGDMPTFLHLMKKFEKAGRGKSRGSVLNNKFNPHHGPAPGFPNTSPPDSSRSESAALFAVEPILMKVEWELKSNKHPEETMLMLKDAKAYLLCMEGHYTEALEVFIIDPQPRKVLHFDVFRLIEDHELFSMVANENIFALLTTHEKKAIDMLVCNVKHFDILAVYQLLKTRPTLCLKYLDALVFKRFDLYDDERFEEMHKHQLQLYAQYQPEGLLKFMRTSSYISLTEALEVCEKNVYHNTAAATAALMSSSNQESKQNNIPPDLTTQRIEILSQMQRYGEALDILILELGDMEEAVRFVKRCEDDRGWADLVDRAIDIFARYEPQPLEALRKDRILEFTTLLLDSIGDHPSAQALIAQLPDAIARHVQKLPLKFKEIIFQHRVRHSMYTCGRSIALCDIAAWHRQMVRAQQLANRVQLRDTQNEAECVCPACQFPLRLDSRIPGPQGTSSKLIVFGCGHVYHDQCLTKMLEAQETQMKRLKMSYKFAVLRGNTRDNRDKIMCAECAKIHLGDELPAAETTGGKAVAR